MVKNVIVILPEIFNTSKLFARAAVAAPETPVSFSILAHSPVKIRCL
jgi:hypothetical protein